MRGELWNVPKYQVRKNSPDKNFIFLGQPAPRRRDIPDKNFMQVAFFCCFRQGVAGMSRDLGRDVPDLEKRYARKLWADFSHPKISVATPSCSGRGGNGRRRFHTPVRGTMFFGNGAVTPGQSRECDITFFVKGRPKSAQQLRDSTVAARRVQSVTIPSSRVTRECLSPALRYPF